MGQIHRGVTLAVTLFVLFAGAAAGLAGCRKAAVESLADGGLRTEFSFEAAEDPGPVQGERDSEETAPVRSGTEEPEIPPVITVYICGAVRRSGVYVLDEGARVYEAVEAAGGLTEDADETRVNQAGILADGEQVTVPRVGEAGAGDGMSGTGDRASGGDAKVDINRADSAELQSLSGIGEAKARDIIAYREEHGPFEEIEDIMKVPGIKTALFNRIRDGITAG